MAVSLPNIATNIRIHSELVPRLLEWSRKHACCFDIAKFQLVHHRKYEPHYSLLPLQIGAHTIQPTESATYLGIIVDRRLTWSVHVEAAIAKGTAAVMAVGRLSRPTFGLPHRYARQLFKAVVCPKLEYGLPFGTPRSVGPREHVALAVRWESRAGLARSSVLLGL